MAQRYREMGAQLGKKISEPGAHIAHAAVGLLLKKKRLSERQLYLKGGSRQKPINEQDPFPWEAKPGKAS